MKHLHRRARQLFYVLEGKIQMEIRGEVLELGPGDAIEVVPGEAHRVRNTSSEDASLIVIPPLGQIHPLRIHCLNQSYLLFPRQSLDLLLPRDRALWIVVILEVDETVEVISVRESRYQF